MVGATMLEHFGETNTGELIVEAIEKALQQGFLSVDLGGGAKTMEITAAIIKNIKKI
jgi:tartrate dehydrogenase/decarboxylase/D-malate dehydrogenase